MSQAVNSAQRTTRNRRCVICGGAPADPRGKGRRCYGFLSSDGKYAHCTREEHAGALPFIEESKTYAHKLQGACACGTTHGTDERDWNDIEVAYDYRDERGFLLYQVVRKIPKDFRQRKPDGAGGWIWSLGETRRVLYRLPQLLKSPTTELVFIVEGEKDVERLRDRAIATTCSQGAGKWHHADDCARKALHGRHLVILADADEAGRAHAAKVAEWAKDVAASIRVIDLYPSRDDGRDVSDWLDEGHTIDELKQIAEATESVETGIVADPWRDELAKALAEVKAKLAPSESQRAPLFKTDIVDLLGMQFDGPRWLITGLVTRLGVAIIGGEPKSIKTWIALEFAIGVATGTKAFGEFFCENGTAIYFFAEDRDVQVRNRARALLAGSKRMPQRGRLFLEPRGTFIDVMSDDDIAWIVASARRRGKIDLLVLDPLRDVHGGEEDKSDSMRDVMRRLRVISDLLECTVLVPHHSAKANKDNAKRRPGQNLRGSSAIHGAIDAGLYIESTDDGDGVNTFTNVATSQVKGGKSAGRFQLELALHDDDLGEAIDATWTFLRDVEDGKAKRKGTRSEKQDEDDRLAFAFVRDLQAQGKTYSKTALREHEHRAQLMSEKRMRDAIERLLDARRLEIEPTSGRVIVSGRHTLIERDDRSGMSGQTGAV